MDFDPRRVASTPSDDPHYITPDVYIHKVGDKYFVVPNDDGLPKLKISGFYKNAMGGRRRKQGLRPGQAALGAVADPVDPAAPAHDHQGHRVDPEVPARVLRQGHRAPQAADPPRRRRGHRHARVDGLARDDEQVRPHAAGHLRAEVLLQLAASRAPTARTSRREAVKSKIKELVDAEDAEAPALGPEDRRAAARRPGIDIARRTVAKYREQLGILSSSKRKQVF